MVGKTKAGHTVCGLGGSGWKLVAVVVVSATRHTQHTGWGEDGLEVWVGEKLAHPSKAKV